MDGTRINTVSSENTDEDAQKCPVCVDLLDAADRGHYPCECGYQLCSWCLKHIRDILDDRCPACRRVYDESKFVSTSELSLQDAKNLMKKRKEKVEKEEKERPNGIGRHSAPNLESLKDVRVIQRNLVYVIGLPKSIARKEVLKQPEYFGQYGKVMHMVINRSQVYNSYWGGPSYSVYVTYANREEARRAIQEINGASFEQRTLRASFGTTKYCSYFLRNTKCNNAECFYLHSLGDDRDSFTKEEMIAARREFHDLTFPVHLGKDQTKRDSGTPRVQTFGIPPSESRNLKTQILPKAHTEDSSAACSLSKSGNTPLNGSSVTGRASTVTNRQSGNVVKALISSSTDNLGEDTTALTDSTKVQSGWVGGGSLITHQENGDISNTVLNSALSPGTFTEGVKSDIADVRPTYSGPEVTFSSGRTNWANVSVTSKNSSSQGFVAATDAAITSSSISRESNASNGIPSEPSSTTNPSTSSTTIKGGFQRLGNDTSQQSSNGMPRKKSNQEVILLDKVTSSDISQSRHYANKSSTVRSDDNPMHGAVRREKSGSINTGQAVQILSRSAKGVGSELNGTISSGALPSSRGPAISIIAPISRRSHSISPASVNVMAAPPNTIVNTTVNAGNTIKGKRPAASRRYNVGGTSTGGSTISANSTSQGNSSSIDSTFHRGHNVLSVVNSQGRTTGKAGNVGHHVSGVSLHYSQYPGRSSSSSNGNSTSRSGGSFPQFSSTTKMIMGSIPISSSTTTVNPADVNRTAGSVSGEPTQNNALNSSESNTAFQDLSKNTKQQFIGSLSGMSAAALDRNFPPLSVAANFGTDFNSNSGNAALISSLNVSESYSPSMLTSSIKPLTAESSEADNATSQQNINGKMPHYSLLTSSSEDTSKQRQWGTSNFAPNFHSSNMLSKSPAINNLKESNACSTSNISLDDNKNQNTSNSKALSQVLHSQSIEDHRIASSSSISVPLKSFLPDSQQPFQHPSDEFTYLRALMEPRRNSQDRPIQFSSTTGTANSQTIIGTDENVPVDIDPRIQNGSMNRISKSHTEVVWNPTGFDSNISSSHYKDDVQVSNNFFDTPFEELLNHYNRNYLLTDRDPANSLGWWRLGMDNITSKPQQEKAKDASKHFSIALNTNSQSFRHTENGNSHLNNFKSLENEHESNHTWDSMRPRLFNNSCEHSQFSFALEGQSTEQDDELFDFPGLDDALNSIQYGYAHPVGIPASNALPYVSAPPFTDASCTTTSNDITFGPGVGLRGVVREDFPLDSMVKEEMLQQLSFNGPSTDGSAVVDVLDPSYQMGMKGILLNSSSSGTGTSCMINNGFEHNSAVAGNSNYCGANSTVNFFSTEPTNQLTVSAENVGLGSSNKENANVTHGSIPEYGNADLSGSGARPQDSTNNIIINRGYDQNIIGITQSS